MAGAAATAGRLGAVALSPRELALVERIKRLKKEAGTHSPSAWTLAKLIPELRLKVDACFLSNPYATKLFLMHFHREVIRPRKLRFLLELYPSQNPRDRGQAGPRARARPRDRSSSATGRPRSSRRSFTGSPATRSWSISRRSRPITSSLGPDTQVVYNVLRQGRQLPTSTRTLTSSWCAANGPTRSC